MGHSPADHVEHAEHAAHAAHDDFNKRVTLSIAIIAAVLACVTMLSHRAHNETLRLQGESLREQGEALRIQSDAQQIQTHASIESTNAANKWAYYQSKNLFHLESKIMMDLLSVVAVRDPAGESLGQLKAEYLRNFEKYDKRLPGIEQEGHELVKKSEKLVAESQKKLDEAQQMMKQSTKSMEQSHVVHQKADRFDYGELGLQLGVVLCSLAILTKGRGFWFLGIAAAVVGAAVAASGQFGLFMGHH